MIEQAQLSCNLNPLGQRLDPDDLLGSHCAGQHRRRQPHRPQSGHQHGVIAAHADLFQSFVNRAESAGHLSAVRIRQPVRQGHQIFFLGQQVLSHPAVALPAIGPSMRTGAGDVVSSPAVIAHPAAGDVIDDYPVAFLKSPTARTNPGDLSARLVPGDHPALIALHAFAQMLVINAANVRPADRRGFHLDKRLAVSRSWNLKILQRRCAVAR
ncbi:MAG: hypothetical protein BWY83_02949 [bacterium ADurb.Bin478]|nr:MAG: hypothetical protein BWY83_02949 [bacterium ADurb.Bin478]